MSTSEAEQETTCEFEEVLRQMAGLRDREPFKLHIADRGVGLRSGPRI